MKYKVEYIENVPTSDKTNIILTERAKPSYVGHHSYEEDDGEWTLIFVYRAGR